MIGLLIDLRPKFELGSLVATAGIEAEITQVDGDERQRRQNTLLEYLGRHAAGDWGELEADDKASNDADVAQVKAKPGAYGRAMSAWQWPGTEELWIITDFAGDQTRTTILRPDEY